MELASKIAGYRAGFLPEERRHIERNLSSERLTGMIITSALDVYVLGGYPGSQIRTW
ncbi:hypothetical protein DFAR_2500012 [Desulfarculales bacterium]